MPSFFAWSFETGMIASAVKHVPGIGRRTLRAKGFIIDLVSRPLRAEGVQRTFQAVELDFIDMVSQ